MNKKRKYNENTEVLSVVIPLSIYSEIKQYINAKLDKLDISNKKLKKEIENELYSAEYYNKKSIIEYYEKHKKENTIELIVIFLKHQNRYFTKKFIRETILEHIN